MSEQNQEIYEYYTHQVYTQNDQEVDPIFWGQVMGTGVGGGSGLGTSSRVPGEQSGQANDNPTSSAAADIDPSIIDHREPLDNLLVQGEDSMNATAPPPPPPTTMPRKRKVCSPINPEDPTDPRTRLAKEPGSPRTEAARRRNAAAVRRFREKKALEKGKRPDILSEQFRQEYQTREEVLERTWEEVGERGLVGEAHGYWDEYMEAVRVLRRMKEDDEKAKKAGELTMAEVMLVKCALGRCPAE